MSAVELSWHEQVKAAMVALYGSTCGVDLDAVDIDDYRGLSAEGAAEKIAADVSGARLTRALTDNERTAIAANARGEDVFCGDDAGAEQIARGACDLDADWSADAREEAIRIARKAWAESR